MKPVAILADDHTDAADSAIHFAKRKGKSSLILDFSELQHALPKLDAVAVTIESRFLNAEQAAKKVKKAVRLCRDAGINRFFKKIDSTMRGNPGGEIVAALEATGRMAALVCTAMPNAGRTCVDGVILQDNVPLHTTRSGHDPFHPLTTSVVADLLAEQCDLKTGALRLRDLRSPLDNLVQRVRGLIIELDPQAACTNFEAECRRLVREAASNTSEHLLLRTLESDNQGTKSGATGELVAGFLGKITRELFRQTAYDIIFATGGNTAMAVARSMGIQIHHAAAGTGARGGSGRLQPP